MTHHGSRARRERGFTLLELLSVMALMSILFGIAVAGLTRSTQGSKLDIAWRVVRNALNTSRVAAREKSALSRVVLTPGPPAKVEMSIAREAGSWHFDHAEGNKTLGGGNEWAVLKGAKIIDGGTVRSCAEFTGNGQIECSQSTFYEPADGFSIAMDIYPGADCTHAVLFSFGHAFTCSLEEKGGLSAQIETAETGEIFTVKSGPDCLAPERWCHIEFSYDGRELLLRAHGVLEARKAVVSASTQKTNLKVMMPDAEQRLILGSKAFVGLMDEVSYRTIAVTEVQDIDPDVEIALKEPVEVRFDSDGCLDGRVHDSVVVLPLKLEGEERKISVDLSGVVR